MEYVRANCVASPKAIGAPAISVNATQQEARLVCACNALPLPTLSALMYPQIQYNNSNATNASFNAPIAATDATLASEQVVAAADGSYTVTRAYSIPFLLALHSHAFTCQCSVAAFAGNNLTLTPPALLLFNGASRIFLVFYSVTDNIL